jgi:hypothetical protein
MFKHNVHIAWRQWRASLSYSLINLGGLTAGLTVALLMHRWLQDYLIVSGSTRGYLRLSESAPSSLPSLP